MHLKKGGKYKEKHSSIKEERQGNFATQRQQLKHQITPVSLHHYTIIARVMYFNVFQPSICRIVQKYLFMLIGILE